MGVGLSLEMMCLLYEGSILNESCRRSVHSPRITTIPQMGCCSLVRICEQRPSSDRMITTSCLYRDAQILSLEGIQTSNVHARIRRPKATDTNCDGRRCRNGVCIICGPMFNPAEGDPAGGFAYTITNSVFCTSIDCARRAIELMLLRMSCDKLVATG